MGHPPATVILVFNGVVRPMDVGDGVQNLSGSRETPEREPGVGSPGHPGPKAAPPGTLAEEGAVREHTTRRQERSFLGHGQVEPDDLVGHEFVVGKQLDPVAVGYPESVAEPAHARGRKLEITRSLARAADVAEHLAIEREDRNRRHQGLGDIEGTVRPDRKIQDAGDKVLAFHGSDAQDFFQLPWRGTRVLRSQCRWEVEAHCNRKNR
ncbi:MAG: hypothetical protein F4151_07505 [Gammaproteobacteria bacterium]|nr:hypothetical protein [Gammaproteobacteria bacterium]